MATADAGLEIPIGFTEQKALQQLARIEARAIKAAQRQQQGFVKANAAVSQSFGQMSRQSTAALQNVSYQLQDVFVQISSGQGAARALGQQLPQLLSGFGAVGAALGLAASLAIPLAASFFDTGEKAKDLGNAINDLNGSLKDYYDAVANANAPTSELIDKYGRAAGAAQGLLAQLAQIAKLDAASTLRDTASSIMSEFESLRSLLATIDAEEALGLGDSGLVAGALDQLNSKFGLTVEQARELQSIMSDQQAATTVQEQADAMLRMAEFLARANEEAGYTNKSLMDTNRAAAEGALAANELAVALEGAEAAAGGVLGTVDQLPGALDVAAGAAANLTRQLTLAIAAGQQAANTSWAAPDLKRFGDGTDIIRRLGGMNLEEQQTFNREWRERLEEEARNPVRRSGGGGRKSTKGRSGGGGGRAAASRPEPSIFERVERDAVALQREIELLGKSSEVVATARARWELLDEAKKRGITVNETLNAQIEAQAAQVGRLTGELERAEIAQDQFETAIDGVADAMAGALVAGESLREGLSQVFKQIASDILSSGIRNALQSAFNPQGVSGGGGFGSFLSSILGGIGKRAAGGPVSANTPYLVGERGPEIIVPRSAGTVIPNNRIGGGMSYAPTFHIGGKVTPEDLAAVRREAAQGFAQMRREVPSIMSSHEKRVR